MKLARNQVALAVTVALLASLILWSACSGRPIPSGPRSGAVITAPARK